MSSLLNNVRIHKTTSITINITRNFSKSSKLQFLKFSINKNGSIKFVNRKFFSNKRLKSNSFKTILSTIKNSNITPKQLLIKFNNFRNYKITIQTNILFTISLLAVYGSYKWYKDSNSFFRNLRFYYYIGSILISYFINDSNHDFCGKTMLKLAYANGGVCVKIGQHLSAMSHVIPEDITKYLKQLQSECQKQPIDNIVTVLKNELGARYTHISDLVTEPVGTASIAQVHKAKLNGKDVVIKVQHLDIAENADQDIRLLRWFCSKIKNSKQFGHKFNLNWLVEELAVLLQDELNFVKEASNATEARHNHGHLPWLVIPRIYQEYTTPKILIMDYEEGEMIDNKEFYIKNKIDPRKVIERISYLFNEMIFIKGFLHSDPHAGNLRIRKNGPIGPVQIILLDHGQYKRFSSVFHYNYCNFLNAVMTSNAENILKYSKNLNINKESLAQQLACMMTGMNWQQIVDHTMVTKGRKNAGSWGSGDRTKDLVNKHLDKALEILENIPSELTIIMKSNDLIRCLEHKLTDGTSPEVYLSLAYLCLKGMKRLELAEHTSQTQFPKTLRFFIEMNYLPSLISIALFHHWFTFKQNMSRRYNNYSNLLKYVFGYKKKVDYIN